MKKQWVSIIYLAVLGLFGSSLRASYDALEARLNFNSLQADFSQTVLSDQQRVISESRGRILAQGPHLAWKTQQPFRQDVYVDGDQVQLVDYDFETVQIKTLTDQLGQLPLLMLTGRLHQAREHYDVQVIRSGQAFRLEPKGALQAAFHRAEIYFDGPKPQKMMIYDAFSQVTRIDFLQATVNRIIPADALKASYPSHFDKIE